MKEEIKIVLVFIGILECCAIYAIFLAYLIFGKLQFFIIDFLGNFLFINFIFLLIFPIVFILLYLISKTVD